MSELWKFANPESGFSNELCWRKMALKRWMYRGGRPNKLTKIISRGWAWIHFFEVKRIGRA